MKTLPNFCAFFERAALCSRVESVYPSLTYPAHTSILTGRKPIHHGIVNNTKLQPGRERPGVSASQLPCQLRGLCGHPR